MRVKRGKNYIGLRLSGPQSTNVLNEAEETAERLAARNEWAFQMSQQYPNLPPILQIERCTRYPLARFKREMVLRLDEKDGWWEIDGRAIAQRPGDDPDAPPPGDDGAPPSGGDGSAGPNDLKPAGGGARVVAPAPKHHDADEFRPISSAPRSAKARGEPQSWLVDVLYSYCGGALESSRFRHITSTLAQKMERITSATRRFIDQAQNALVSSHELYADLYASFSNAEQFVQQENWFGAVFEPQTYEQPGLRLTLLTFSAYPKPNWESWLFGRLPEDQQVAV